MGEPQKQNDLFYVCSVIEYLSRVTHNTKKRIIEKLWREKIQKLYELAEAYHCEPIEKVTNELIHEASITEGEYNYVEKCKYEVPSYWDIGRVYQRLVLSCCQDEKDYIDKLLEVLSSWIIEKIDNYNSSMYYENPSYLYACYENGKVLWTRIALLVFIVAALCER